MDMMSLRRRIMGAEKTLLPREYQQVEYLESTGTQYIDVTQDYAMYETVVVAAVTKTRTNNAMICGYSLWSDANRNCVIQTSASVGACRRVGTNAWTNDAYINIEEYDAVNRILRFETFKDHALVADATTGEELSRNDIELSQLPTIPVYLFHGASNSNTYVTRYISARIYRATFYLNGETVYDFIPCYRKSDQKPGMYDLISGEFYTNAGSGEFICGSDV